MGMKETEGSLQAYFLLAGGISGVSALNDLKGLSEAQHLGLANFSGVQMAALWIGVITRIALGVAFIVAGLSLKTQLKKGADWIKTMLVLSGATLLMNGALTAAAFTDDIWQAGFIGLLIGLLITIYLYRSVVRLSREARAKVV
ncbi:MAG: hypothetical protein QM831_18270 [Kofleriaceae bacterium]